MMKKALFTLLVILAIASIGHALVLPQATPCLFIDLYDFEKEGSIYFRKNVDREKREEIKSLITRSGVRVATFWGAKTSNPKFIYCNTDQDYLNFGSPFLTPAAAVMHLGSYVIIGKKGVDLDIISHELAHTELFERIGPMNRALDIPVGLMKDLLCK